MTPLETAASKTRLAKVVLEMLGERTAKPRVQVERMIRYMGREFVIEMMRKAQEIEANGGLMCEHRGEKRRRTFGGVFFFLAQQAIDPKCRDKVFPPFEVRDARWKRRVERKKRWKEARDRARAEAVTMAAENAQAVPSESAPLNTEKSAQATPSTCVSSQVPEEIPPAPSKANVSSSSASLPKPALQPLPPKPKGQPVISKLTSPPSTLPQRESKPSSPLVQSRSPSRGRRREAPKLPEVFVSVRSK